MVGRIGRAHGIRGQATVEVRTDDPELRFAVGARLLTEPAERGPLVVTDMRFHSGILLLSFEGVADRNGVEALRNTILVVEADPGESPEDPDEFYDHQLVGLAVVTGRRDRARRDRRPAAPARAGRAGGQAAGRARRC